MKKKSFIYLVFWILPFVAFTQWSNNPNQNIMIADTTGTQILPIVVSNSLGETYISWQSEFGNLNFDVYLQKFDKSGVKLWDESGLQISNHETATWISRYDMKLDNDENVILVNQDQRTGHSNVFAYKISPSGEFLWGNDGVQLSNTTEGDYSPIMAVADNNDVVFIWGDDPADTLINSKIFVKRVSAEGSILWESVLADTVYDFMLPQILKTTNNDFIVSWMTKLNLVDTTLGETNWMHAFAQKFDTDGQAVWENNIQIDSGQIMPYESLFTTPYLESDENGGAYVLWQSFTPVHHGGMPTTYLNRLFNDGVLWKPNGYNVSQLVENNHTEAQMIYMQDVDKIMVCWKEYHYGGTDCWGVRGQLFDANGNYLWADTGKVIVPLICTVDTAYGGICLDESTNNNALLIYNKDYRHIVATDTSFKTDIFAMLIDTDGEMVWSPSIVPLSLTNSNKYQSALSNLGDNQWVLAWNDNISDPNQLNDYGTYAQNISVDGTIGPVGIINNPLLNNPEVKISPNPCSNTVSIDFNLNTKSNVKIDLLDMNGHFVKQLFEGVKFHGLVHINTLVSDLLSNVYLVRLQLNNSTSYHKIIKVSN